MNFIANFTKVVDHDLRNYAFYRWLLGGTWVMLEGCTWIPVDIVAVCKDGSNVFQWTTYAGDTLSIHEHHPAVRQFVSF